MKWKDKERPPRPKEGDVRRRTFFAFAPRLCADGYWHWLCRLILVEQWDDIASKCGVEGWEFYGYEVVQARPSKWTFGNPWPFVACEVGIGLFFLVYGAIIAAAIGMWWPNAIGCVLGAGAFTAAVDIYRDARALEDRWGGSE